MTFAVRFRTTSGLDSAVDPIHMKNVTFEHVKGVEEAKNELQDVVEFLRNPQKFTALGGKLPKGITLPYRLQNEHLICLVKSVFCCRDPPCWPSRYRQDFVSTGCGW